MRLRLTGPLGATAAICALALVVCAPKKKSYTIPSVTKEIKDDIRKARQLKRQGKLKDASDFLADTAKKVLSEYPEATLTQEPVKKLMRALDWIANLCLDRSLELKQEAVSSEEDELSKNFKAASETHHESVAKLRKMIPRLQSAKVSARKAPMKTEKPPPDGMSAAREPGAREPAGMEPGSGMK